MDKNKIFVAIIIFVVIFGGIVAVKAFREKPVVTVLENNLPTADESPELPLEETAPEPVPEEYPQTGKNNPLIGTSWEWVRTDYIAGTRTDAPKGRFVLSFDATQQRLSSSTDCNSLASGYLIDGEVLSIGPIASTKMACMQPTFEEKYSQELGRTASYVIQGNELRLNLWKDTGTMIFIKK